LETIVKDPASTYGPEVAEWASRFLGIDLMPWQRRVLDQQLAFGANGQFVNHVSLVSVARQNGKTAALKALIGWWLTKVWEEPQTILTTAHRLDLACALFQDLAPIIEAKFGLDRRDVVWAYGRNQLKVGANKWLVRAAKPSAGHGLSCDLIIVDELFGVDTETLDIGLRPTQRARANPLLSMWSTAGTEESVAMLKWREEGLRAIDTGDKAPLYLAEYSPPPELDPMSSEAWEYANPALGYTLGISTLEDESHAPNRAGFLRSSVNLWVQTDTGWLTPGLWKDRTTNLPPLPGGVLACEVSVDDGRYCGVRVNHNAENVLTATVAFMCDTLSALWDNVESQASANPGLTVAITPTLDVHCPSALARRRVVVGYREITSFTGAVRQSIAENKLQHTGETMLAEHVGRAVAVRTPGAIALSSTKSPGPIELARCLVWAAGLMSKPRPNVTRPQIAFVRRNA
jgi:phage terminase large subunit-like protein